MSAPETLARCGEIHPLPRFFLEQKLRQPDVLYAPVERATYSVTTDYTFFENNYKKQLLAIGCAP